MICKQKIIWNTLFHLILPNIQQHTNWSCKKFTENPASEIGLLPSNSMTFRAIICEIVLSLIFPFPVIMIFLTTFSTTSSCKSDSAVFQFIFISAPLGVKKITFILAYWYGYMMHLESFSFSSFSTSLFHFLVPFYHTSYIEALQFDSYYSGWLAQLFPCFGHSVYHSLLTFLTTFLL